MALKDIKTKIASTNRTNKVTRAMEAVSAVKMRKTQATALAGRSYARAALAILTRLAGTEAVRRHPLSRRRAGSRVALVLITSDKGLAGGLNSGVLKRAGEAVKGHLVSDVSVYAYGRKGEEHFRRRGYQITRSFENKSDDISLTTLAELSQDITDDFMRGNYDRVVAVYSNFKSTFEQVPMVRELLPLSLSELQGIVSDIVPAKGKWSHAYALEAPAAYEIEPSDTDVLDALIPRLITVALYHMLLEAKASEHSARMVAMKNASDKSKEVAHDLTRLFNRIRQANITREVSEIIGGREALAT